MLRKQNKKCCRISEQKESLLLYGTYRVWRVTRIPILEDKLPEKFMPDKELRLQLP